MSVRAVVERGVARLFVELRMFFGVRAVFIAGNRFCSHRGECVIRDFISGRLHGSYGRFCHKVPLSLTADPYSMSIPESHDVSH